MNVGESSSGATGAGRSIATVMVVAISLVLIAGAMFMTRIAFFKAGDADGFWHARIMDMTAIVPPIAALFFAHGLSWWRQGLRVRAALALSALPIWAIVLRSAETVITNDFWWAITLIQLQGIQPFGAPQ